MEDIYKLRQPLELGEKEELVLSERIKKEDSLGKFHNSSTENREYFNKDKMFFTDSKQCIEGKYFY